MTRRITVRVKPGSSKGPLVDESPDEITVFVREKAIDGGANAAVERALAAHFGTSPSRVRIVRGFTARIKQVDLLD